MTYADDQSRMGIPLAGNNWVEIWGKWSRICCTCLVLPDRICTLVPHENRCSVKKKNMEKMENNFICCFRLYCPLLPLSSFYLGNILCEGKLNFHRKSTKQTQRIEPYHQIKKFILHLSPKERSFNGSLFYIVHNFLLHSGTTIKRGGDFIEINDQYIGEIDLVAIWAL